MKTIEGLDCILLIDDDEPTNYIHERVIRKSEYDVRVVTVTSAEEGLEFLSSTGKYSGTLGYPKPGIIFLDINMPRMNGWEFLVEYAKLPEEQKARVVMAMLTTSLNPSDADKAEDIKDIEAFLNKPLTAQMIDRVVDQHFPIIKKP